MTSALERIEEKLDKILDHQSSHNGRLVKLETQASFIKAAAGVLFTATLAAIGWVLGWSKSAQ